MKIYTATGYIGIKFADTDSYPLYIFLGEIKSILPDGNSYFINYRKYPRSDFMVEIPYAQLSDWNDTGGVPTYADLLTALLAVATAQQEEATVIRTTSSALEASHVISAVPASLYWLNVYNDKSSAQYIQVHDSASLPANSAGYLRPAILGI